MIRSSLSISFHYLLLTAVWICAFGGRVSTVQAEDKPTGEALEFFEKKIRPVLVKHCYECHSAEADEVKGNLRVDSRKGLREGGDSGPAVIPEDVDNSVLIQAVRYGEDSFQMPPAGKLSDEIIAVLEEWVRRGAPDPRDEEPPVAAGSKRAEAARTHWAFQPPRIAPLPAVQDAAWPQSELDHYVLARLESQQIEPAAQADRRTLIHRLYFDLIGLPPTFDEVEAFVQDDAPDSVEQLVDELLARPQFGERWGRHWLDVARYSDTKGYVFQEDRSYPEAYTYRDWVIQTLNRDLPYRDFLKYQIAADQLPELQGLTMNWQAAMGFFTLGRRFLNNKHDVIDDRIDVLTRGTLGLTVTCARCHDHKFDPISIEDYYGLYGVFDSSTEPKNEPSTLRLVDAENPHNVPVLLRGQPGNHGPVAQRQFLTVLSGPTPRVFEKGSGRLELAEAIVDPANPLTARVMVNRVWLRLFGEGLVTTPSDFGVRSDPPSQPEALDLLAVRFMQHDWSLKRLIRDIVLAQTYQQDSTATPSAQDRDPENRLFGRQNRRRYDFEALRDAVLTVAGELDQRQGGPSVDITSLPTPRRRTAYAYIDRQNLPGVFRTFDFAGPDTHSPQRLETTTPQQALFLMNHGFVLDQCQPLVQQAHQSGANDDQRIAALYRRVLQREPSDGELAAALSFLAAQAEQENLPAAAAPAWQYGFGSYADEAGQSVSFQPLPHFTGQAWQGGSKLPDADLGWVFLNAKGGHPGNPAHAAVRRWIAPHDGNVSLRGSLHRPAEEGDGVRARAISSRHGKLGEWLSHKEQVRTGVANIAVQAGDTLDLVVDCLGNESHDGFQWTVTVKYLSPQPGQTAEFRSEDLVGPRPAPLTAWQQLAQVLLLTNEFQFVD